MKRIGNPFLVRIFTFVMFVIFFSTSVTAATYYIDPVNGNDTTHSGRSSTLAFKTFRNVFCYRGDKYPIPYTVRLAAGDTIYVMNGTIHLICRPGDDHGEANETGRPSLMRLAYVNGTAESPIRIMAYPGASPVLDAQYQGEGLVLYNCSHIEVSGITIYRAKVTSEAGAEGGGLAMEDVQDIKIHNLTIYDTDGQDNANMSGLHSLGCNNVEISNCILYDNYDRTAEDTHGITTPNSTNMVFFGGGNISIHDCLIYETQQPLATINTGAGIKYKAASSDPNAYFRIYRNVFRNCKFFSVESGTGNTHIHNNIFIGGNVGVTIDDPANYTRLMNEVVEYNTFYNLTCSGNRSIAESAFSFYPTLYWNTRGYPGSVTNIVFRNNIVFDIGSYSAEHTPVYVYGYIDDSLYNASIPEMHINNNCYYNFSGNDLRFSIAYATGYGTLGGTYDWNQWRALTWTNPLSSQILSLDFDINSVASDPLFLSVDTTLSMFDIQSTAFRPITGSPAETMGAYANCEGTSVNDEFIPSVSNLSQNFPNPFNPKTVISYSVPAVGTSFMKSVVLKIYDILGREIAVLVNGMKNAGNYTVEWNSENSSGQKVGSGVYFYELRINKEFFGAKKMLLLK